MGSWCLGALFTDSLRRVLPVIAVEAAGGGQGSGGIVSSPLFLLIVYCILISMSSMWGGVLPMLFRLTHTRMQLMVSLIGGLMLGVGIFHQLPHAVAAMPEHSTGGTSALDWCMAWLMIGLLLTFFMLRMFHFHSHEPFEEGGDHEHDCAHDHDHSHDHHHGHDHDHGHQHDHDHDHGQEFNPTSRSSWIGIFLGLSLHTLLDGVALAANVQADALHDHHGAFAMLGFGTFLGVVLHKPLDSLSILSLMAAGRWSPKSMRLVNFGYALMCPIGAGLFYFGIQQFAGAQAVAVAAALAMSAGVFICISLSDLLPEVQFHSHDRLKLSAALMAGILLAWGIGFLEPEHTHNHANAVEEVHEHDHGHDHDHHHHAH